MIVILRVSNYDIVGGIHFWGTLVKIQDEEEGEKRVVTKVLSKTEARLLTEGSQYTYHEGDMSERFRIRDRLRQAATFQYKQHWPEATHLIESQYNPPAQPHLILDGSGKDELNALYEECERLDWWDGKHYDRVADICDEWDALLGRLTL